MIIYRLIGRAALWPNCGTNMINPKVSTNLAQFRREIQKIRKQYEKDGVEYTIALQKLVIASPITKELVLMLFEEEAPDVLIKSAYYLSRWEYQP